MLELSWHCMEDAGYDPFQLHNSITGVFIGTCNFDYKELLEKSKDRLEGHAATGLYVTLLPNRISHFFGFHGPSIPIDTACSSTLISVHRAVEQIRQGHCELAIAGGVNAILRPELNISFAQAGMPFLI